MKNNNKGFTLAELLIVVAIIAVLAAISIPVFTARLEASRESTDISNVRSAYALAQAAVLSKSVDVVNGTTTTTYRLKDDGTVATLDTNGNETTASLPTAIYYDSTEGYFSTDNANSKASGTQKDGGTTTSLPAVCKYKTNVNYNNKYLTVVFTYSTTNGVWEVTSVGFPES